MDAPVLDVGFRHVEGHHADIGPEIPPAVVLLEEAAVFAHEDGESHVFAVEGFPRGDHDFALERGFGGDGEFDGRVYDPDQRIKPVELDISLRECVLYGEQREQERTGSDFANGSCHGLRISAGCKDRDKRG